jgi:hypothetical protein
MGPRSNRLIDVVRETILRAEEQPELGPGDPGVVELRRILNEWVAEREAMPKPGFPTVNEVAESTPKDVRSTSIPASQRYRSSPC